MILRFFPLIEIKISRLCIAARKKPDRIIEAAHQWSLRASLGCLSSQKVASRLQNDKYFFEPFRILTVLYVAL